MVDITSCMTGNFDFYCLLVETVFGNLLGAFLGVSLILLLMSALLRMNPLTIMYVEFMFFTFYFTLWWGAYFGMIMFIVAIGTIYVTWLRQQ